MTDRSRLPLRLAPLLALLLLGAVVAPATWAQDQDGGADGMGEGTELRSSYDEVLDEEAALEEAVDLAATRRARLLVDIATVQRELDTTRAKLDEATLLLQAAVRKRDVARAALRAAQRRLKRATEQLHAQAVSSYVTGGTENEMLAVLISSAGDVSATGRTLSYATAVVDHQREVIDAFNAARRERNRLADRAESAARAATDARDELAGVAADQEATQKHLMELAAKEDEAARYQELALQQLRGRKIEIEARVVALEKESDSIGILLAAHQAKQKDYKVGSIEFRPPLEDIDLGSGFGMRVHPILRYERLHAGVDLSAPSGTAILAAAKGKVVLAEPRGGYGNCVVISHGFGIATVYAHQSRLSVQPGDKVEAGDVIGAVGSTGLSTGPHLHFETRVRGVPVDPENFIDLEAAAEASREGD